MRVDEFDFDLPERLIALRPAVPRTSAKLLAVRADGGFADRAIADLPDLLEPGDVLVFNDTRVIPAQLEGRRIGRGDTEPSIGATLHQRIGPSRWKAFVRGARKLRTGDRVSFGGRNDACLFGTLDAQVREDGAVAAPTAGLHFTPELVAALDRRGIVREYLTLHVGAGTFLPVKAETTEAHRMHAENGRIDANTAERLNAARGEGRRIVAVGTTSLRLLESAADDGGTIRPFERETDIFITPGYRFRTVDRLLTNFHLPRSTLFMLVSAFSGTKTMRAAYGHAIGRDYRFYSYGDACLLTRTTA